MPEDPKKRRARERARHQADNAKAIEEERRFRDMSPAELQQAIVEDRRKRRQRFQEANRKAAAKEQRAAVIGEEADLRRVKSRAATEQQDKMLRAEGQQDKAEGEEDPQVDPTWEEGAGFEFVDESEGTDGDPMEDATGEGEEEAPQAEDGPGDDEEEKPAS